MHTRIKWLALTAFRSFVDRTVINFPESGLSAIKGLNKDTGGSSGSGKTSIILGINYALGICHLPATGLQSWLTDKPMSVELCLDTSLGEVVISRGGKLAMMIDGAPVKGGAAAIEDRLQNILGLSPELLEALTYRRQMTRGQFLSKTNSEKQSFLTLLLGLEKFETAAELTQKTIGQLEPVIEMRLADITRLETEVAQHHVDDLVLIDEAPATKAIADTQVQIHDLEWKMKEQRDYIATLSNLREPVICPDRSEEKRLDALLQSVRLELTKAIAEDQKILTAEREKARWLQKQLDDARRSVTEISRLKASGRDLMEQIYTLEKNVCPTCKQQWAAAQEKKRSLESEVEAIGEALQELQIEGNADRVKTLEAAVQTAWVHTANPDIEGLRNHERAVSIEKGNESARIKNSLALATAEQNSKLAKSLEEPRKALDLLQYALQQAGYLLLAQQSDLHQIGMKNAVAQQAVATQKRLLEEAQKSLEASRKRAEDSQATLSAERDFLALVGRQGFLGSIYDEVLWEISTETNRILGGIPNTAHVTVNFKSESLTQKNKIVKEITPVCMIGGHEAPIKAGCSGGMISAVELAVDLAVAAVVSRRTGAIPSWIILDEAFEGLGIVEKEGCLEILRSCADDKLVLIVDHASEIKAAFEQTVEVEYRNGISVIL